MGIETGHTIPDAKKGFLGEIFGGGGVADNAEDNGIDQPAVLIVEFPQGFRFAGLQAGRESPVGF